MKKIIKTIREKYDSFLTLASASQGSRQQL